MIRFFQNLRKLKYENNEIPNSLRGSLSCIEFLGSSQNVIKVWCSLLLEDRENLFRDFWTPFSISSLSFSARRNYFKKKSNRLRAVTVQDTRPVQAL